MAILALSAPVNSISGSPGGGALAGVVLPASEPGALSGFTGFSVPNNGSVLVRLVIGSSGVGTAEFVVQRTVLGAMFPVTTFAPAVANSTAYIFGPFPPSIFNDANGLLQVTMTGTQTANTVGVYVLPGSASGS